MYVVEIHGTHLYITMVEVCVCDGCVLIHSAMRPSNAAQCSPGRISEWVRTGVARSGAYVCICCMFGQLYNVYVWAQVNAYLASSGS